MGKKNWRSNSNSSGDESTSNSVATYRSQSTARKLNFDDQKAVAGTPDSQRTTRTDVDPEDAQSVYPPEWCVFVAKYAIPLLILLMYFADMPKVFSSPRQMAI
jgi:hypothetical protein